MPEGEGSVLDNSCIMFLSNMFSGTKHDNKKVPVVTAGGLSGARRPAACSTTAAAATRTASFAACTWD